MLVKQGFAAFDPSLQEPTEKPLEVITYAYASITNMNLVSPIYTTCTFTLAVEHFKSVYVLAKPHRYVVYRKQFPKRIRGVYTALI